MALTMEDMAAARQAKAAAAAAAAEAIARAARPDATPAEKFAAAVGLPEAPPMHSRLYDIELTPSYVAWMNGPGRLLDQARQDAQGNAPAWRAAVQAYNTGAPVEQRFVNLLRRLNSYYTDGAASPGRLYPELAAEALQQWAVDSAPSALEAAVNKAVPLALHVAAAAAGADLLMGGTLISGGAATVAAAPAAGSVPIAQAAQVAAVDAAALETGVSAAMESAAMVSAASAPGVAGAVAATAEMTGAAWGTLATGTVTQAAAAGVLDVVAKVPTQVLDTGVSGGMEQQAAISAAKSPGVMEMIKGADMGTIFDGLGGTIADAAKTATNAYGSILGAQTEMAKLDLLKAQTKAAMQPGGGQYQGGGSGGGKAGMNSQMLMLGMGGVMLALVLVLALRR